jgi:hypothetical protein
MLDSADSLDLARLLISLAQLIHRANPVSRSHKNIVVTGMTLAAHVS